MPATTRSDGPGRSGRWRGQRGQTTAMVVTMLFAFVLFVGMVVNVGQAVNRRIALQVVADAGAFTGASRMAEGLNYIAWANGVIQDYWAMATVAWVAAAAIPPPGTCGAFDAINGAYQTAEAVFDFPITTINLAYANIPYTEAKRVSRYNVADMFPGEENRFSYREVDFSPEVGVITPARDISSLMDIKRVPNGTSPETSYPKGPFLLGPNSKQRYTQPCWTTCGILPCILPKSWSWNVWYKRSDTSTRYFVWIVKAPATKGLMYDTYFGPNLIPEMRAVAAARPVGGSIEKGDARYTAELVPVKKVMATGGFIQDQHAPFGFRQVVH